MINLAGFDMGDLLKSPLAKFTLPIPLYISSPPPKVFKFNFCITKLMFGTLIGTLCTYIQDQYPIVYHWLGM